MLQLVYDFCKEENIEKPVFEIILVVYNLCLVIQTYNFIELPA